MPRCPAFLLLIAACTPVPPEGHRPHARFVEELDPATIPRHVLPPPAPLRAPSDRPDRVVYGYWPYWGDALDTLYWDQLTHVAVFNVELSANGSLTQTQRWTQHAANAMSLAARDGVHVHLCVTSFNDTITNAVLPDPARRATAVSQLAQLVAAYGAHGVNVDIEGMDATNRDHLTAFVTELKAAVGEVVVALPAIDWSRAYDYADLAAASDGLFIMGYDYHWGGGNPGPVAPLLGGAPWSNYSLTWTLNDYRAQGAADDKLLLGLPLYGRSWPTTNNNVPGTTTGTATSVLWADAVAQGASLGRHYDAVTDTPYAFPSATRQLWYDDRDSLEQKLGFAVDEGIAGVGFWALTYEDSDPAFWQMVDGLTHPSCPDGDGDGVDDCADGCPTDAAKQAAGVCGCGVADLDGDGDGAADCVDTCPADPAKSAPGVCGCGLPDADTDGDGQIDCNRCGDGTRTAPETCDDGNVVPGDGCDATCRSEQITVRTPTPGRAGRNNNLGAQGLQPGHTALFLGSVTLGRTNVPGCPGVTVPLAQPRVLAQGVADAVGDARGQVGVPAAMAGRSAALVAVDLAACRVSAPLLVTFR